MIPRLNRLSSTRLSNSQVVSTPFFTLRWAKNNVLYPRFAFVVSKKIDKRAVVRNRLKRVLREIAYEETLKNRQGVDLLFIVRKNFKDLPRAELNDFVKQLVTQITI